MLIAPLGGIGALTRSPIGVIRGLPETREMLLASIREVYEVARATAIEIEEKAIDDTMDFIDRPCHPKEPHPCSVISWRVALQNCTNKAVQS